MRHLSSFAVLLLLLLPAGIAGAAAQEAPAWGDQGNGTYRNPVLNTDYSDPDVIRVGDKFYMTASEFHFTGMQVLESDDLVNWRIIGQVYDRFDYPGWESNERYAGGSWAPALRYHDGRFWIFFCTPHEGLFMTTAEHPEGPWAPLHCVRQVETWEDPCPFWDEDGQAYLGRSRHGAGPIIIHRMSPDGRTLLDEGQTVYRGPVAEGTKIHKRNGWYYLSIPEGGVSTGWQTLLRSRSIYGPYEKRRVLEQGPSPVNGPHQGALVDLPDGRWFFLHFQRAGDLGRVMHLQPAWWTEDDWLRIGVDTDGNGVGEPVSVWEKPLAGHPAASPQSSDDFAATALGLQWQFNHNPVDRAWSLTERPGCLMLHALPAPDFRHARNTLTQKVMGYASEATATLDLGDMAEGQRCGLAGMGKSSQLLGVRMTGGRKELFIATDTTETCLGPVDAQVIHLRAAIDLRKSRWQFAYSLDGHRYTPCGDPFTVPFGHWKGARTALFCYNTEREAGAAAFLRFDYRHDGPQTGEATAAERLAASIQQPRFAARRIEVTLPADDRAGSDAARRTIQQAIDACSAAGGGQVAVTAGCYRLNGPIVLKSGVDLHLEAGATLLFSGRPDDFLPAVFTRWEGTELYGHSPMIYALHASDIGLTGPGTVDAQGGEMAKWSTREAKDRDRLRSQGERVTPTSERVYGKGTILRPSCIQFVGCTRVLVEEVTVRNSPFWTIHPVYCDQVTVRGVTIDSHYPNNDGCDPESTSNVLIEHCNFRTGDDAIAIKAGRDADGRAVGRPSRNIVIRNCRFNSECNGLCIGSEMSGGVENVYLHDIRIGTVKNAIYFKSNRDRGGYIRNVFVTDITVERARGAILRFETNYFGFRGGRHASTYEHFLIRNVEAGAADRYAIFMDGYEEAPMRDIRVERFRTRRAAEPCYVRCAEEIRFDDVEVNGERLPIDPPRSAERKTLDVY